MHNLASAYHELGRYSDALALQKEALEFRQRIMPGDHPSIGDIDVCDDCVCVRA
jgi:hypothetical protein